MRFAATAAIATSSARRKRLVMFDRTEWLERNRGRTRELARRWAKENPERRLENMRALRCRRREWYQTEVKPQMRCVHEGDECSGVLLWHHVDPQEKAFDIANGVVFRASDVVRAEIEKCICLCRAHHNRVHANG